MSKKSADLVVINAKIYTLDEKFSIVGGMAIKNDRILACGNSEDIQNQYNAKEVLDLKGQYVYPGFIDNHCHFWGYGVKLQTMANLKPAKSFQEVVEILLKHQKQFGGDWITGRGWDQNKWDTPGFPDNTELDKAFPDVPVVLTRIDGHAVIVNTAAIKALKLTESNIEKKSEALYKDGKFSGVFLENTADLFKASIPGPSVELIKKGLDKAQNDCFAVGLTTIADAGLDLKAVLIEDSLQKAGFLKMQVYAMLDPSPENIEYFIKKGPYITPDLSVRSVKLYADGALGSRGACLLEPYSDDPANTGIMTGTVKQVMDICELAYKYDYQVNTHCIGDSANREFLNIYAKFLKTKNDKRWRIEHAQIVDPVDLYMFARYSIIPSVQATHATSDMYWAEKRLGNQRIKYAYAYRQLLNQNNWLANGTDFPIEEINPLYTFYAAVTRKDLKGFPTEGFQKENALSREEALRSITIWPARACFEESRKGSLEAGKYANFVVLDQDLMTVEEGKMPQTRVMMTYLKGVAVFKQ